MFTHISPFSVWWNRWLWDTVSLIRHVSHKDISPHSANLTNDFIWFHFGNEPKKEDAGPSVWLRLHNKARMPHGAECLAYLCGADHLRVIKLGSVRKRLSRRDALHAHRALNPTHFDCVMNMSIVGFEQTLPYDCVLLAVLKTSNCRRIYSTLSLKCFMWTLSLFQWFIWAGSLNSVFLKPSTV